MSDDGCVLCDGELDAVLGGVRDVRFGVAGEYRINRCRDCGLEQTAPRPTGGELRALYERHYNFGGEADTAYTGLRERLFGSWLYRLWLAIDGDVSFHRVKGSGRLLDVGCNEGRGLALHRQNGFDAEGLEPNRVAAADARARGFTVHAEDLRAFEPGAPYDIVVLSNVLEHALDPSTMLADVGRILRPGGEVWISCPNSESVLRRIFARAWINWHVPFHIVHFSGGALRRLLARAGFEVIAFAQETPALWVAQSLIAALYAEAGKPTARLRSPFLLAAWMLIVRGIFFPILWIANQSGRGDCLVVRARRN